MPARNAFSTSAEVFPEQPGESITRVEVPTPRGAFTVVVPAPGNADAVSLVRVAPARRRCSASLQRARPRAAGGALATTDIATFTLQISR